MYSPWQSLTSAMLKTFLTLLHTLLPSWSPSPREQFGQLFPLALSLLGNQPRCSGGFSLLPHRRPTLEQPLPSRVPRTSIARSSLDLPLQAKVNSLLYMLLFLKTIPMFSHLSFVFLYVSDQEEQLRQTEVTLSRNFQGAKLPVCSSPFQPAGLHLSPAKAG